MEVDDGAASAFVAIDCIQSFQPPDDGAVGMVESKCLDMVDNTVTREATVKTPDAFTFVYEHSATRTARIDALKGNAHNWKFTDTTAGTPYTRTVPGVLVRNQFDPVTADGLVTVTATVEVTGAAS